jgi:FkbH-like protein
MEIQLDTFSDAEFTDWLRQFGHEAPSVVLAHQVAQRVKGGGLNNGRSVSLAILRSSTVELLLPYLTYQAALAGFKADVWLSGYSDWRLAADSPNGELWTHKRDAIIIALDLPALAPEFVTDFARLDSAQISQIIDRVVSEISSLVAALRKHSRAPVLVQNFVLSAQPALGLLDAQIESGQNDAIWQLNRELRRRAAVEPAVYIFDVCGWANRTGLQRLTDRRLSLTSGAPLTRDALNSFARELMRHLSVLLGTRRKCLVLDLDNTLWGGTLGEDGFEGIRIGMSYPGNCYRDFQQAILDLSQRGVILTVCSKNDEAEALRALDQHPDMVLRSRHFACKIINWDDKAASLRRIAENLNIGLDSLVFLDDNPAERALVRVMLPEVLVPEMPKDPADYAPFLRDLDCFEILSRSTEDLNRGAMYQAEFGRTQSKKSAGSLPEYYFSLGMELEIGRANSFARPRIAQLTQKTNQFNLTTRRYTEADIRRMEEDSAWRVYWLRLKDRFGDSGISGVGIMRNVGEANWEIDTFLLSCRILGRTIETAFLAHLLAQLRTSGAENVYGWFMPTSRNAPAQNFYQTHGFRLLEQNEARSLWILTLQDTDLHIPPWFTITESETAHETVQLTGSPQEN